MWSRDNSIIHLHKRFTASLTLRNGTWKDFIDQFRFPGVLSFLSLAPMPDTSPSRVNTLGDVLREGAMLVLELGNTRNP